MKREKVIASYKSLYIVFGLMLLLVLTQVSAFVAVISLIYALYIILGNVETAIMLLVMTAPLDRMLVLPGGQHVVAYLMVLLLAKMLYDLIMNREIISSKAMSIFLMMIVFLLYEFSHFIFYDMPSITRNILYYACMFVSVTYVLIRPKINIQIVAIGMGLSAIVGSMISLVNAGGLAAIVISTGIGSRFAISGEDVNTYGVYLLMIASLNFALWYHEKKGRKIHMTISILLVMVALLSLSRGVLLNLLVLASCLFIILFKWTIKNFVRLIVGLLIVVSLIGYFSNAPLIQGIVGNYTERFDEEDLSNGRIELYMFYIRYMRENPEVFVYGVGMENYKTYSKMKYSVHNTLIEMWLSEGVVGVFLIGLMMFSILNRIRLNISGKLILYALPFVSLMIGTLTLSLYHITSFYYYLLLAVMCLEYCGAKETELIGSAELVGLEIEGKRTVNVH